MPMPGTAFYGGSMLRDLCLNKCVRHDGTLTNGPKWVGNIPSGTRQAGAILFDGSDDEITIPAFGFNYDIVTISAWIYPTNLGARNTVIDLGLNTTGVPSLEVGNGSGTATLQLLRPGVYLTVATNSSITASVWQHIAYVRNANNYGAAASNFNGHLYLNGNRLTYAAYSASETLASTSVAKKIGRRGTSAQTFNGMIGSVQVNSWSPAVEADADVWAMQLYLESRSRLHSLNWLGRRTYSFASGGGAYTLTAAQGSFALTGQAAGLRATRLVSAAQGSFSLSGQSAALKVGRKVTAAQGSFALTGQDAALRATRTVSAAVGSFTLTGQAANLRATRLLTAAYGTFTLTGQAANLVKGMPGAYTLTASQGSFALSGQSVGLIAARHLAAGQGAFALTGQAAGLSVTRRIVAACGSFTLSGQAASLLYSGEVVGATIYAPVRFAAAQVNAGAASQQNTNTGAGKRVWMP